jgi:hypothetical protein
MNMTQPRAAKKAPSKKAVAKPSSKEMAKRIISKRVQVTKAVHAALAQHGLPAVKLHSMRFSVAAKDMSDSSCPDCGKNEQCVFDTDSGQWVCAPK